MKPRLLVIIGALVLAAFSYAPSYSYTVNNNLNERNIAFNVIFAGVILLLCLLNWKWRGVLWIVVCIVGSYFTVASPSTIHKVAIQINQGSDLGMNIGPLKIGPGFYLVLISYALIIAASIWDLFLIQWQKFQSTSEKSLQETPGIAIEDTKRSETISKTSYTEEISRKQDTQTDEKLRKLTQATLDRAAILREMSQMDNALAEFKSAYDTLPSLAAEPYAQALYQLGQEKEKSGDSEGALRDFSAALEVAPEGQLKAEIQHRKTTLENPPPVYPAVCPNCGKETQPHWKACPFCGTNLSEPRSSAPKYLEPEPLKPKSEHQAQKTSWRKAVLWGAGGIVLLLVFITLASLQKYLTKQATAIAVASAQALAALPDDTPSAPPTSISTQTREATLTPSPSPTKTITSTPRPTNTRTPFPSPTRTVSFIGYPNIYLRQDFTADEWRWGTQTGLVGFKNGQLWLDGSMDAQHATEDVYGGNVVVPRKNQSFPAESEVSIKIICRNSRKTFHFSGVMFAIPEGYFAIVLVETGVGFLRPAIESAPWDPLLEFSTPSDGIYQLNLIFSEDTLKVYVNGRLLGTRYNTIFKGDKKFLGFYLGNYDQMAIDEIIVYTK